MQLARKRSCGGTTPKEQLEPKSIAGRIVSSVCSKIQSAPKFGRFTWFLHDYECIGVGGGLVGTWVWSECGKGAGRIVGHDATRFRQLEG